jgi:carbonic anhydrase
VGRSWRIAALVLGLALLSAGCGGDDHATADALAADARLDQLETEVSDLQAVLERHLALSADAAPAPGPATGTGTATTTAPETPTTATTHATATTPATAPASAATAATATTAAGHAGVAASPHWTYAGAAGTEHWGELDPSFATCATGTRQSPVDLGHAEGTPLDDLRFGWHASAATVVNDGHTVQVTLADGGDLVVDGRPYHLRRFHVHAPSEHTVNGRSFPLEIDFVHEDDTGRLAVVGLLVGQGAALDALAPLLAVHPQPGADPQAVPGSFDPTSLLPLPPLRIAYRYEGSLTTPPCTEGVTWAVLFGSTTLSAGQLSALTGQLAEPNARPTQPLDGRTVRLDTSAG